MDKEGRPLAQNALQGQRLTRPQKDRRKKRDKGPKDTKSAQEDVSSQKIKDLPAMMAYPPATMKKNKTRGKISQRNKCNMTHMYMNKNTNQLLY